MTLKASGVSLSATGPPGGGAFSMTRNAGGRGPSESRVPPGVGAFSRVLKASGSADCAALEPGACEPDTPGAGWGRALGGWRIVAAGGVLVEGRFLTVGVGLVVVLGRDVTLGGSAPGLPG